MTGIRRLASGAVVTASALLAMGTALLVAPAAVATTDPGAPTTAAVRLAHLSPTTTPMDVYVEPFDGSAELLLADLGYGAVSQYVDAAPGAYVFSWRPAGTATTQPPVLTMSAVLQPGAAYTVAGIGIGDDVRSVLIGDDLTSPSPGGARVRFINADASAGPVDLTIVGGAELVRDADYATVTDYAAVPAGPWSLDVVTADAPQGAEMALDLAPGSVNTLLLLDTDSPVADLSAVVDSPGITTLGGSSVMSSVSDSVGAPGAPVVGGIATGLGGTWDGAGVTDAPAPALPVVGIVGLLLVVFLVSARLIRRS